MSLQKWAEDKLREQERQRHLENRRVAVLAAGMSWGGISSVRARNTSIVETAEDLLAWLERDE